MTDSILAEINNCYPSQCIGGHSFYGSTIDAKETLEQTFGSTISYQLCPYPYLLRRQVKGY